MSLTTVFTPESSPDIDIVAVHGLGDNGITASTYDEFLPGLRKIPHARIMRFSHDFTVDPRLPHLERLIAQNLLANLVDKREGLKEIQRPLIFIAYEGTAVVEKALSLEQLATHSQPILRSTLGIVLIRTYHQEAKDDKAPARSESSSTPQSQRFMVITSLVVKKSSALLWKSHEKLIPYDKTFSIYGTVLSELRRMVKEMIKRLNGEAPVMAEQLLDQRRSELVAIQSSHAKELLMELQITERVAARRRRLYGVDHAQTLATMNNVALRYSQVGRLSGALRLMEEVVARRKNVLGTDHPTTLTSMKWLATQYREVGRQSEATTVLEELRLWSNEPLEYYIYDELSRHNHNFHDHGVGRESIFGGAGTFERHVANDNPKAAASVLASTAQDSGYGTLKSAATRASNAEVTDDTASVLSVTESVMAAQSLYNDTRLDLVESLALLLTRELATCAEYPAIDIESLLETMPTLLRNFSAELKVEQTQSDAFFQRSAAAFVRLNRRQISRKFAESVQARMDLTIAEIARSNQDDKPTIQEEIELLSNHDTSGESEADCALDVDDNADRDVKNHPDKVHEDVLENPTLTYLTEARKHVEESTSFRLMVEKAKAVLKLTSLSQTTMKDVRLQVDKALREPTGRISSSRIYIECHISWDPAQFLIDQFENPTEASLCDVITITSSNEDFQAATCLDYVGQVWPITGEELLLSLQDYVHNQLLQMPRSIPPLSVKLSNGTHVKIVLCKGRLFVKCDGLGHAVAEVIEELAWLGAACREHSVADQLGMCFIDVRYLSSIEPHITVTYCLKDLKPATGHATDSSCWHALFRNAVVVQGYPIKRRTQNQQGLEMSMELMLGLGLTDTVTVYNRGLVIDGLQSMFVPVGRWKDSIQWHYIHSELDECIMYSRADEVCPDRLREDRLDESALGIGRNFVGWTTKAELLFGSDKINYKSIRPSHLDRCGPGYALEKASITAGKFLMLGVTIVPGQKDKASHHDLSSSYKMMIGCAARRNVILYDAHDQLGWLTDAASALLHLSRAQLSLDILEGVELQEYRSPDPSFIGNACIKALLDNTNRTLEIDRQYIGTTEERILVNEKWETKTVVRYRTIYFEDMVKDNWKILNQIFSYSVSHTGIELPTSIRKHIEGFDFDDIVHSAQQMFPLTTPLDRQRGAWLDFAKNINAITLFGTGFGDLIIPAAGSNKLCDYWSLVPKSLDYLVVSVAHLERLRNSQFNSQECHSENIELGKGIYWHRGDRLFEHCDGCTTSQPCDRAQKLNARIPGSKGCMGFPTDSPAGAVIFGHMAHKRLWGSKDELHARLNPQSRSHSEQTDGAFSDSGMGASIGDASSPTDPPFPNSKAVAVPASWGRMIHQSNISRDQQPGSGPTVDHKDSQMRSQTGRLLILCKTGFRRHLSRSDR